MKLERKQRRVLQAIADGRAWFDNFYADSTWRSASIDFREDVTDVVRDLVKVKLARCDRRKSTQGQVGGVGRVELTEAGRVALLLGASEVR